MRRYLHTMLLLLLCCPLTAQAQGQHRSWEEVYAELMTAEDAESEQLEDNYELLEQLSAHPLDINRATREELEQLPFLTAQQVMDLQEYLDRYGRMRSLGELRMVRSMDYRQLQLLPFFVYAGPEETPRDTLPSLRSLAAKGRHTVEGYVKVPFYQREGDRNGYLGYRYKHWLHYDYNYFDRIRFGLVGAQDAGEPFLSTSNRWGYDYYSYYLQLQQLGCLKTAVLGKYKLSAGMGLVLNTSFSLGKLAMLQSLGRTTRTIRPHASRSEADYMQGLAVTIAFTPRFEASLYASYRPVDATLDKADSTASTLITSGYHRTPTEMQKKYNTHITDAGAVLRYRYKGLRLGATAAYTHLDRPLEPNRETLYRRYYAHGTDFLNLSADYSLLLPRFSLTGETAVNELGALATINALSYQPSGELGLLAVQRFFSYRYTALHGNVFSEGGHVQNESSVYLGITWQPLRYVSVQAYTDWAYFPWARYQVSQSSYANDHLLSVAYQRERWSAGGRYRLHQRQRDNAEKTGLEWLREHRARLWLGYAFPWGLSLKTQADAAHTFQQQASNGLMLSQQADYTNSWLTASLSASWFKTDDYDSRLYSFERSLPHSFSVPALYGEGIRLMGMARVRLGQRLQLGLRLGFTRYFDRDQIGTGLQAIDAPHATDLDLHLRWKF